MPIWNGIDHSMKMKEISRAWDKKPMVNNNMKTTNACKFPKPILIAFEKGYGAIDGVIAQPINTWKEALDVKKQLIKDAETNGDNRTFKTV